MEKSYKLNLKDVLKGQKITNVKTEYEDNVITVYVQYDTDKESNRKKLREIYDKLSDEEKDIFVLTNLMALEKYLL